MSSKETINEAGNAFMFMTEEEILGMAQAAMREHLEAVLSGDIDLDQYREEVADIGVWVAEQIQEIRDQD